MNDEGLPWGQVSFVIPCFNDATSLIEILRELPSQSHKLIIDDGSQPKIILPMSFFSSLSESVHLIRHPLNLGQGAAIETGFEYIRRNLPAVEYVFTFDSDGQHSVNDAVEMLKAMKETPVNIILGSRFLNNANRQNFQGGGIKFFILNFAAKISKITLNLSLTDRHNGLRLLTRYALAKISLTVSGYGHADEILRLVSKHHLSYREVPVQISYQKTSGRRGQLTLNAVKIVFDRFWGTN